MFSLIVARDKNNLIGNENGLPWRYPEDLLYFKETTLESIVIMGSNTFKSIGKRLPNRTNIVITGDPNDSIYQGVFVSSDIKGLVEWGKDLHQEIFIIGGRSIYEQFLPYVDRLYITEIDDEHIAKEPVYFPDINWDEFELVELKKRGKLKFTVHERIGKNGGLF